MQLIGNVKGRQNRNLARVNRQRSRRDFAHPLVDIFSQLLEIFRIAIRPNGVGLVVNLDLDGGRGFQIPVETDSVSVHWWIASTTCGSAAAMASSMACTFDRIASRSA